MNISELSIRRPVLATVLTLIIILFGAQFVLQRRKKGGKKHA